jgi:hypothetical protein
MRMSVMSDGWIGGETERLPSCRNYWLVITTVPLLDVVMRTGRAVRPGTVRGALIADGCETARVRARELVAGAAVTGAVTAVPVADCVTVDGNGTRCGIETFAVPVRVAWRRSCSSCSSSESSRDSTSSRSSYRRCGPADSTLLSATA